MTLVNAVMKVKYGKAPDKGRAVAATCGLLAEAAFAVGSAGAPYIQALKMQPAIRIERTTCGLRSSANPLTDNLTPQETRNQDAPEVGEGKMGANFVDRKDFKADAPRDY